MVDRLGSEAQRLKQKRDREDLITHKYVQILNGVVQHLGAVRASTGRCKVMQGRARDRETEGGCFHQENKIGNNRVSREQSATW